MPDFVIYLLVFAALWVVSLVLFAADKGLNKLWEYIRVHVLGQDPCRLDAKALDHIVGECVHICFDTPSPVLPQTPDNFAPPAPPQQEPQPQGLQPQAPPVATAPTDQQVEWYRQQLEEAFRGVVKRRVEKLFPV